MKTRTVLSVVLLGLAAGCDPTLGEAFDDVQSAAPDVCADFCNPLVDCEWKNLGEIIGPESAAMLTDLKAECTVECAYRADSGVFVYEYDWDETAEAPVYTVKERLDGAAWVDYLECLVDAGLWVCVDADDSPEHEHWSYEIDDGTPENCATYNGCVALLDINLEFEWNPQANEGEGDCHASGDEYLWGDW